MIEPGESIREKTSDADTPQTGPRELLPDFDQRPPFQLTIAGTKLGFASATDNVGEGPVWVRGAARCERPEWRRASWSSCPTGRVRVYDGAGRLRYTPESTHSHWHLLDFQRYELRDLEGTLLVRDRKSGFCLADHYGLRAARSHASRARASSATAPPRPAGARRRAGTSTGYTDLYPPHFHGQNLELRGVPAGVYVLVHRANPTRRSRSSTTRTTPRRSGSG